MLVIQRKRGQWTSTIGVSREELCALLSVFFPAALGDLLGGMNLVDLLAWNIPD